MDMATAAPAASGAPAADNDAVMKAVIDRFLGGEWQKVDGFGNQPLEPTIDGDTKVYDLSIDKIKHRIDALHDPLDALGFNATWPGPRLRVTEGDRVRARFTNNLDESTGIHFHGQAVPNAMDGVPGITQKPIKPGASVHLRVHGQAVRVAHVPPHHNATDQVGRGLLGRLHRGPHGPGGAL